MALYALPVVLATAFHGPAVRPRAAAASSVAMSSRFSNEVGVQPPLGFVDPLKLTETADFDLLRLAELKHGRVAMLAIVGHLVTAAGVRLPGDLATGLPFSAVPPGLKALSVVPEAGLLQIVLFAGFLELFVMKDVTGKAEFPGDYRNGWIDFGWDKFSPETKLKKRAIELNNGRAAQMGILALMVHEAINKDPYVINSLLGQPVGGFS